MAASVVEFGPGPDLKRLLDKATARWGPDAVRRIAVSSFARSAPFFTREVSAFVTGKATAQNRLLHVRSGALSKSIASIASERDGAATIETGTIKGAASGYFAVQELGTQGKNPASPIPTIRPVKGKALAIPIGPALTDAGLPRYTSPRQYPVPLDFRPINRGNVIGLLVDESDKSSAAIEQRRARASKKGSKGFIPGVLGKQATLGEVAYILVKKVDIPAHYFVRDGFFRALPPALDRLAGDLARLLDAKAGP